MCMCPCVYKQHGATHVPQLCCWLWAGTWSWGSLHPPGQEDTHGAATGKALHKAKHRMKFHHLTFPDSIVDCSLGVIFDVPIGSATTLCPKCKIASKK